MDDIKRKRINTLLKDHDHVRLILNKELDRLDLHKETAIVCSSNKFWWGFLIGGLITTIILNQGVLNGFIQQYIQ